jgi:hypothetical protein
MVREQIEHLFAVVLASSGFDPMPQHDFFTVVVQLRHKAVTSTETWIEDRPPRECAGDFRHVFLCVSAVDAERV